MELEQPMDDGACATIAEFEQNCQSLASIQEELLCRILRDNASCSYLHKYGSPLDPTAFRSQVPVISYDDFAGDIEKIVNGDKAPLLCNYPITCFFASSGTSSGRHKIIPSTAENTARTMKAVEIAKAYKQRCLPGTGRALALLYCMDEFPTKSGIPVGSASTFTFKSEAFKRENSIRYTTPHEMLVAGSNWRELTYCHLLCALLQRDEVQEIEAIFAYTICEALRLLRSDWQDICSDIKSGTLSSSKVASLKLREAFASFRSSRVPGESQDRQLADDLFEICSRQSWSGILLALFPRVRLLSAVVTGTMAQFIPALKDYAGEQIQIFGKDYYSSEGLLAININPATPPEQVIYTISPATLYYEFVPPESPVDEVVAPDQVVTGKHYELVVTNFAGLYRCRVGDVVTVVSKFHDAPQLAFSHRKNAVLSVQNEMVDEQELQNNVMKVSKEAGIQVANFTCHGDSSMSPPHYKIFWELDIYIDEKSEVLARCCSALDRSLNAGYAGKRIDGVIGPLELVIVKQGTFEKLMEEAISTGASPAQYKTPRCVHSPKMLEVLSSGRLESYTSEEMPRSVFENWEPSFPQGNTQNV